MSLSAAGARIDVALGQLAALRARPADEIDAELRLEGRITKAASLIVERIAARLEEEPPPTDPARVRAWIGDIEALEEQLAEALETEVGESAADAIREVSDAVAAAKAFPSELVDLGLDKSLDNTLTGLRRGIMSRLLTAAAALVAGSEETDTAVLIGQVTGRIGSEASQLARHVLGDVRSRATESAERDLGVTHHRWVTAGDDDVRPAHAEVDGEVVRIGERFSNGWLRPGGVGCRCRLEPVLET